MILVIDSNILLVGLIRDSIVRRIIVESGWEFYYPEISFHEVRKYKDLVLEKSGMSEAEYMGLLNHLLKHITFVPEEQIKPQIEEANEILGKIDPEDVVFLAATLSLDNSKIWSDDNHFQKQSKARVLKTEQIVRLFYSSNL